MRKYFNDIFFNVYLNYVRIFNKCKRYYRIYEWKFFLKLEIIFMCFC